MAKLVPSSFTCTEQRFKSSSTMSSLSLFLSLCVRVCEGVCVSLTPCLADRPCWTGWWQELLCVCMRVCYSFSLIVSVALFSFLGCASVYVMPLSSSRSPWPSSPYKPCWCWWWVRGYRQCLSSPQPSPTSLSRVPYTKKWCIYVGKRVRKRENDCVCMYLCVCMCAPTHTCSKKQEISRKTWSGISRIVLTSAIRGSFFKTARTCEYVFVCVCMRAGADRALHDKIS